MLSKKLVFNYFLLPLILLSTIIFILFNPTFIPSSTILKVDKSIDSRFFEKQDSKYALVFFGYVGCVDVCTPRLHEISLIYDDIKDKIKLDVFFINLTNSLSDNIADLFVKGFNKDFIGVQLPIKELEKLKNDFDVFSVRSLKNELELNHTSFLFLIKKEEGSYKIKRIFTASSFNTTLVKNEILGIKQ